MSGKSELFKAVINNDLENIKDLIEQGADLHANHEGALRLAADFGHLEVVKYLLEQGANIHFFDEFALRKAAENGQLEVVKYLLEQGADLRAEDDYPLRWAAENGHLEVVKYLLEQEADLHAKDDYALRWAAGNGYLEVVKYLVEQGADVDRLSQTILIEVFTSYDLQIKKITPRLSSLLLKTKLVKKSDKESERNKILSTYKKKIVSSLIILMYHLYYRPSGPGFFQAIEQI